jgi:hypothetical protein
MDLNVYSFLTLPLLSSRFAKPRLTLLWDLDQQQATLSPKAWLK